MRIHPASLALLAVTSLSAAGCGFDAQAPAPGAEGPPQVRSLNVLGCEMGLRVEFLEDLDPKTVTSATVFVENASGLPAYDPASRAVSFRPEDPLTSGQIYTAVLGGDIRSAGGTPMGQALRWQFACIDQTPPVVVARWPVGDDVSTLVHPGVRFSEPVDRATIHADNLRIEGVESTLNYDPSTRTVTFVPRRPLYPGRSYSVVVSEGVRDRAGNPMGTVVSWSFRTRAPMDDWAVRLVTPPIPEAAPCNTPIELRLGATFDVDVSRLDVPPVAVEGVDEVKVSYDPLRRVVRLTATPIKNDSTYRIFATGTLRDRAGDRPLDEGTAVATLRTVAQCSMPTVASVEQAFGSLACDGPALIRFSSPMDEDSTSAALVLRDLTQGGYDPETAPEVPTSVSFLDDTTAAVTPDEPLVDGHRYWLGVDTSAEDLDGNPLAAPGGWEITARCEE